MRVEQIGDATLYRGDCREVSAILESASIDSIVTDPPYGLKFMGKGWDHGVPGVEFWELFYRVCKPGAHMLAFGGTRTYHRLATAIEDAGWEIRDQLAWMYGSGFPKSKNVALSIDKGEGFPNRGHRIATASRNHPDGTYEPNGETLPVYEAKSEAAREWEGWGTALKPAWEPICMARKPLSGTVAANVLKHGTGAINVDGCRVEVFEADDAGGWRGAPGLGYHGGTDPLGGEPRPVAGRWPANILHDGSPEIIRMFPEGSARFFYTSKASKADREDGLDGVVSGVVSGVGALRDGDRKSEPRRNIHPTVKPTDLIRYFIRLVTSPGGVVYDPFMGSGSHGKAAILEGFRYIGVELDPDNVGHFDIACRRIEHAWKTRQMQPEIFDDPKPVPTQLEL